MPSSPTIGHCRLCGKRGELRKSHVLSEFVYRPLYDERYKSYHVLTSIEGEYDSNARKGIWERLFCDSCEQQFSVYEQYAAQVLDGRKFSAQQIGERTFRIEGVEYRRFKLFQLSVLLRASISSNRMFKNVRLGPHEQRVGTMLRSEDPGQWNDYPCLLFGLQFSGSPVSDLIDQPDQIRLFDEIAYRFIFGSFCWVYVLAAPARKVPFEAPICENNVMTVVKSDLGQFRHLQEFGRARMSQGRLR